MLKREEILQIPKEALVDMMISTLERNESLVRALDESNRETRKWRELAWAIVQCLVK